MIETFNLTRTFKSYEKPQGVWESIKSFWNRQYKEKMALHPANIKIESGQIVGLVGANGAGKTTLLKLLSGLIYPTSGDAKVLGFSPWERKEEYLRQMSILLGQKNQLWWDLPAVDSFHLLGKLYDLNSNKVKNRVEELSLLLDCRHVLTTQLRRLSLGERMKMELIGSLLHEPKILFLDEPTIGLDVVAQTTIRQFLNEYVIEHKPTVILTSHYMDDIAKLSDRLMLMSQGQIVYDGTVDDFVSKSEIPQEIDVQFFEPLIQNIQLNSNQVLSRGEKDFKLKLSSFEVPKAIAQITSTAGVNKLTIGEVDFEEVIMEFMEKESRFFSARNDHQPRI